MAKRKIKLTRPELKRQRDALRRFERFLPTLKLKQQQLQLAVREVAVKLDSARQTVAEAQGTFDAYRKILAAHAGVDIPALAEPEEIRTATKNIAGVNIPILEEIVFPEASYSLFATPAWVDRVLADLRELNRRRSQAEILTRQYDLLRHELVKITQRVNLFEKVTIPRARESIRVIRIKLGDEMTAGVARAKIAKNKLAEAEAAVGGVETAFSGQALP